jgi:hypothetical protein
MTTHWRQLKKPVVEKNDASMEPVQVIQKMKRIQRKKKRYALNNMQSEMLDTIYNIEPEDRSYISEPLDKRNMVEGFKEGAETKDTSEKVSDELMKMVNMVQEALSLGKKVAVTMGGLSDTISQKLGDSLTNRTATKEQKDLFRQQMEIIISVFLSYFALYNWYYLFNIKDFTLTGKEKIPYLIDNASSWGDPYWFFLEPGLIVIEMIDKILFDRVGVDSNAVDEPGPGSGGEATAAPAPGVEAVAPVVAPIVEAPVIAEGAAPGGEAVDMKGGVKIVPSFADLANEINEDKPEGFPNMGSDISPKDLLNSKNKKGFFINAIEKAAGTTINLSELDKINKYFKYLSSFSDFFSAIRYKNIGFVNKGLNIIKEQARAIGLTHLVTFIIVGIVLVPLIVQGNMLGILFSEFWNAITFSSSIDEGLFLTFAILFAILGLITAAINPYYRALNVIVIFGMLIYFIAVIIRAVAVFIVGGFFGVVMVCGYFLFYSLFGVGYMEGIFNIAKIMDSINSTIMKEIYPDNQVANTLGQKFIKKCRWLASKLFYMWFEIVLIVVLIHGIVTYLSNYNPPRNSNKAKAANAEMVNSVFKDNNGPSNATAQGQMDLVKEESGYLYTWLIMTNVGIIGLVILHIFWNKLKGLGFTGDATTADAKTEQKTATDSASSNKVTNRSISKAAVAAAAAVQNVLTRQSGSAAAIRLAGNILNS